MTIDIPTNIAVKSDPVLKCIWNVAINSPKLIVRWYRRPANGYGSMPIFMRRGGNMVWNLDEKRFQQVHTDQTESSHTVMLKSLVLDDSGIYFCSVTRSVNEIKSEEKEFTVWSK